MKRFDAVKRTLERAPESLVVHCNGMIGREGWTAGDEPGHFYMIGSMGLASSVALGLALAQPGKRVLCIDGDGNVLMGLGALASVAASGAKNLYHVCLDNEAHGSTGDQATISAKVELDKVAAACGYARVAKATDEASLERGLETLFAGPGPAFLLVKVERGNVKGIGRVELTPRQLTDRMRTEATR